MNSTALMLLALAPAAPAPAETAAPAAVETVQERQGPTAVLPDVVVTAQKRGVAAGRAGAHRLL